MKAKNILAILCILGVLSCKKDTKTTTDPAPTPSTETGSVKLEFENLVDALPLVFGTKYVNQNGDTFTVSKFKYFISNIVLTKEDNSVYAETESYHQLSHSSTGPNKLTIANVPIGNYTSIRFMLGVDSARNTSGAQTGDLDPAKVGDMYWSWSTGYIFLKLEGNSPQSSAAGKFITYHIGGFGGVNKTQRTFNFNFASTKAIVSKTVSPSILLTVNVNELFKSPNLISFATKPSQTSAGANAKVFADNYADMISFKQLINP